MTFISYAQNYEDVMLRRALKEVDKGFYIDVGANDPVIESVTKAFYNAGWRGINIEPVSEWYEKLQHDRPEDINLQLAAGARKGHKNFFEVVGTGLSTMDELIAMKHAQEHGYKLKRYKVPVVRLTEICGQYPHADIHFIKIDVEGAELLVLQGLDLKKIRPWIVLVESTLPNAQVENYAEWQHFFTERGYHFVYFDGLSRYYVADEHSELDAAFMLPPNYLDHFKRASEDRLEHHAKWLESEWNAAKINIDQLKESADQAAVTLQGTEQQRQQLEAQLQILQAEVGRLGEQLREKETKQQELLLTLVEKETKLQEVAATLRDNKQQIDGLHTDLAVSKDQRQVFEVTLQGTEQQRQQLDAQLQTLQAEAGRLGEQLHGKEETVNWLNNELQTVYDSKSWRITWPLRKLMQLLKWLRHLPTHSTLWIVRLPKRTVRWLLVKAMAFALRRSGLKAWAMVRLSRYPRLDAKLRHLAQTRGLDVAPPSNPTEPAPLESEPVAAWDEGSILDDDLSHLTPSARRIYAELKTAMAQHRKKGC